MKTNKFIFAGLCFAFAFGGTAHSLTLQNDGSCYVNQGITSYAFSIEPDKTDKKYSNIKIRFELLGEGKPVQESVDFQFNKQTKKFDGYLETTEEFNKFLIVSATASIGKTKIDLLENDLLEISVPTLLRFESYEPKNVQEGFSARVTKRKINPKQDEYLFDFDSVSSPFEGARDIVIELKSLAEPQKTYNIKVETLGRAAFDRYAGGRIVLPATEGTGFTITRVTGINDQNIRVPLYLICDQESNVKPIKIKRKNESNLTI
ncbi:hypothetical protein [uncultured Parasutterella sp.]|uniref:hypothetical protein n=1 Tax=uncultured Parasutterella sp. TaxID=1263098 RepID=UPI0034A1D9CC